ncbi:hypothetical protein GALMADRAFT_51791 [Galerina marginata CBS 339.88]|uniref:nicotinamidase n=1 Tax=Galerina marginata (strain CBS 339.88) TaxID=685588 RepID=A0A067TTM2_GALM3|nr:hypothetical protein GALMADRAFT_51791 [Galerina marginata CBS 339.88]
MNGTEETAPTQPQHAAAENPNFVPALVVIDMQNDFVSGSLAVPGGETIIDSINCLIDLPFRLRIATRDFHPDNHVSFADTQKNALFSKVMIYHPDDKEQLFGIEQVMWPVHCVGYTDGSDFVPKLNSKVFDAVIHKGTHPDIESYSAFRDIWGKSETDLPRLLKEKEVTDVFFVGLAGDYCVKYTAIDAAEYGYNTWVVTDAIKSIAEDETVHFDQMQKKGIKFTTAVDVKTMVQRRPVY